MILGDEPAIRSAFSMVAEVVQKLDAAIPRASADDCYEARLVRAQALLLRDLLSDLLGEHRLADDPGSDFRDRREDPARARIGSLSNGHTNGHSNGHSIRARE